MKDIGLRIKARREELGMSQEELAHKIGYVSRSSVNKIELGQRQLRQTKIAQIAEALGVSPTYIMGWDKETESDSPTIDLSRYGLMAVKKESFPIVGEIACGKPIWADEQYECDVSADENIDADFCLRCKGDSMTGARIYDGDIVFVKSQPTVENGEIAVVLIDDEATLKRFYRKDGIVMLQAENPAYPPMIFTAKDGKNIRILGKAVAFQSIITYQKTDIQPKLYAGSC